MEIGQTISPKASGMPLAASQPWLPVVRFLFLLSAVIAFALGAARLQAQTSAWNGLQIPQYSNASKTHIDRDDDEYTLYFHSDDTTEAVFAFYRAYLEKQGFRVTRDRKTSNGFEAHLERSNGGKLNRVELDAKYRHGRYKVEIEVDD